MSKTKTRMVDVADVEGIIRPASVTLKAARNTPLLVSLMSRKHRQARKSVHAQLDVLLNAVSTLNTERALEAADTAGERELVLKYLAKDHKSMRRKVYLRDFKTRGLIASHFSTDKDSIVELIEFLDEYFEIGKNVPVREKIIFRDLETRVSTYHYPRLLDGIRMSHPEFAVEDFSDLSPEKLETVKLLLRVSCESLQQAKDTDHRKASLDWKDALRKTRDEIALATPHMTRALATVALEHPERFDDVMKHLSERGATIAQSDELIEQFMVTSNPLSIGAL